MLGGLVRYCAPVEGTLIVVVPAAALIAVMLLVAGALGNPFPDRAPLVSTVPLLLGYAICALIFRVLVM